MANFADDPAAAHFLALHGVEGYGLLMRVYEIVCGQFSNDGQPAVGFPITEWCRRLGVHRNRFNKLLLGAVSQNLIEAVVIENLPPDARETPRKLASNCPQTRLELTPNPDFFERFSLCRPRDTLVLFIPNLLRLRDEYSRKSGHAPDKVAPDADADADPEKRNVGGCELASTWGGEGGDHPPSGSGAGFGGDSPGPPRCSQARTPTN